MAAGLSHTTAAAPHPPQRTRTATPQPAPVPPHCPSIAGSLRCTRQIQLHFPSAWSCEQQVKSLEPRATQPSTDLYPTVPRAAAIGTAPPSYPPPSFTRGNHRPGSPPTAARGLKELGVPLPKSSIIPINIWSRLSPSQSSVTTYLRSSTPKGLSVPPLHSLLTQHSTLLRL